MSTWSPHYRPGIAFALASEFGTEARVAFLLAAREKPKIDDQYLLGAVDAELHVRTMQARDLATRAAHFAHQYLDGTGEADIASPWALVDAMLRTEGER